MFSKLNWGFSKVGSLAQKAMNSVMPSVARCEDGQEGEENSIMKAANAALEAQTETFKTPMPFEVLRMVASPTGSHNNFDGARITVTKLLNMNSQVMHTYMLGSSQTGGQPVYQYRAFYGTEDSTLQVGSDFDFNSDGYARKQLTPTDAVVSKWAFRDGSNHLELNYEGSDASSSFGATYAPYSGTFGGSFMQAVTPCLAMGGLINVNWEKKQSTMAFGGIYEKRDHTVVAVLDEDASVSLQYTRRVNPNRVHLSSEYKISPTDGQTFAVGAEYTLKQAKLQMSVDSNMVLKSALESQVQPGVKLQMAAELQHGSDQFKCGVGLAMGD